MKYRPLIIAERHNASFVPYLFYCYLKKNPNLLFNYCLFEGGADTQTHLEHCHTAFEDYKVLIRNFLKIQNSHTIYAFLEQDLYHEYSELYEFSQDKIDKKKFPYGLGQLRNLSVHFLLYHLLKKQNIEWIAIDDKRRDIKKIVEQKIINGTAYLYKKHKNIGQVTTLKQKILLEAAPIRSKYMSDKIFNYAQNGKAFALIGSRHAFDLATYTPDLADIVGYNPQNEADNGLYHYNISQNTIRFNALADETDFMSLCRPLSLYNMSKIKSNFDLNTSYLNLIR